VTEKHESTFEGWAILELMGHRKLGGYVREVPFAGSGLVRIDVPAKDGKGNTATQFYSPASLYCMTPVSEEVARRFAATMQPEPVTRWELPPRAEHQHPDDEQERDGEEDAA
jgi:hypothetical protein